ncbi:hypothetical protein BH11ARM1_BH11ARM1_12600 [soil metagenome]
MNNRAKSKYVIGGALLLGVLAGFLLTRRHNEQFAFLDGARPLSVQDGSVTTSGGTIHGTTTFYSFQRDWHEVLAKAKAEMPDAIERQTMVGGAAATTLTIPRYEDGRMRLFFPPVREVTILPQRLVLTEGGQIMSKANDKDLWASVKVSEYHQPHILESAVDWFRDHIDI